MEHESILYFNIYIYWEWLIIVFLLAFWLDPDQILWYLTPVLRLVTQKSNLLHITLKNSNALYYMISPWKKVISYITGYIHVAPR